MYTSSFYAQSPDFLKPGLCYFLKFLYLYAYKYSVRYQAERCDGCPLRDSCFKARGNRIIEVNHQLQHYKQKARD